MTLLGREDILGADDFPTEVVECPEWGGEVLIRSLSGAERDEMERMLLDFQEGKEDLNVRAKVASWVIVDEEGKQVFRKDDVQALGRKNASPLDRIFDAVRRLSAMTEESKADVAENFTTGQNDDSIST